MVIDPRFTKAVSGFVQVYKDNEIPSMISGDSLTLTLCNRTATTSNLGNYFVSVNLPTKKSDMPVFQSLTVFNPELQQLNVDEIILIKIPNTAYTEFIDARSIELNVPILGSSSFKIFSSTYKGTQYGEMYGETSPLLGDNIAYLFCDSVNRPYTGLTVDEMGVMRSHSAVSSWNPPSRDYKERPSAVSYAEVKLSNDTINTDRRLRMNKTVFTDGLFPDYRGIGLSFYGMVKIGGAFPVPITTGFVVDPNQNYFKVGDEITIDPFLDSTLPCVSGNAVTISSISADTSTNKFYDYYPDPSYGGPWSIIYAATCNANVTNRNQPGYLFESGGTYYNYDIPVGFVVLDKGLIVITHTDIVTNIDWSAGYLPDGSPNAGADTTNIYFDDFATTIYGQYEPRSILNFTSLDTMFQMKATCNCLLGEFFVSSNQTWNTLTIRDPLAEDDPLSVTEVGLYNEMNELIGLAKFSEPIKKGALDLLTFEIDISL